MIIADRPYSLSEGAIKSVKIHEVAHHLMMQGTSLPQYLDEVVLSCSQQQFFTKTVKNCARGTQHLFEDINNSQTPKLCREIIDNPASNFVANSKKLAEHFTNSHPNTESSSILIIIRVTMNINTVTKSFIAILNVEYTNALQQVRDQRYTKILKFKAIVDSLSGDEGAIQTRVLIDVNDTFKWDVLIVQKTRVGKKEDVPLTISGYFKNFLSVMHKQNDPICSKNIPEIAFHWAQTEEQIKCHFKILGYTLIEKIGEGGFGIVYKAIHTETKKTVAIKIMFSKKTLDTDAMSRHEIRFKREINFCSQLQHPNIIRLLDKGKLGDHLFAVFSFIDGVTLKQKLFSCGALSPIDAFNIMMQVLDALIYTHSLGIVHRDIKPANIMLSTKGTKTHAVILDFGIGTLTHQYCRDDVTSVALIQECIGSPAYATPEQLRGEPCTAKTDLYLWGLTLVECLTGQPLVSGSSLACVFQKQLELIPHALPTSIAMHPLASLLEGILHKKLHQRLGNAVNLYQSMSRLDFTALFSNLGDGPINVVNPPSENRQYCDETLITPPSLINTPLIEQKQITIMCIKLDNKNTATAHSLTGDNPQSNVFEQMYQQRKEQCICIAQRYGATHISTLGDTLTFYFGYPKVADDDCRLCVKSALEMIQWNCRQNSGHAPQPYNTTIHIGIHSGMVLIRQDGVCEGNSINMAKGLSRQAKADQILCGETTRQILARRHREVYIVDNRLIDNIYCRTYSLLCERRSETSQMREQRSEKLTSMLTTNTRSFFSGYKEPRKHQNGYVTKYTNITKDNLPSESHFWARPGN
ncbi:MAG: serine/threonine protein kinase [Paraglaciecola sp.]